MAFSELGLAPELLRAIAEEGYTEPTPIQQRAIPCVLAGRDVLAAAQTGTGKTAAFTLPILQRLSASTAPRARALVLVPTRELAAQVAESVRTYGRHLAVRTAVIFGGVGMTPQLDALKRGVDLIVATPGRLLEHVGMKSVDLSGVEMLVLDEADRMLDMGFIRDIRRVLAVLPKQRQNLLFSATFNDDIRSLAEGLLQNPERVEVTPRNTAAETVTQRAYYVDKARKTALIAHLVNEGQWQQVLVFTRTKHGANRLAEQLARAGLETAAIHGNKSQNARTRALAGFKSGEVRVLVATDIAARGIDIDQLPHVINHELPNVPEDYVHRIGRTGRAGSPGEAISLVGDDERPYLRDIQKLLKKEIPVLPLPEFAALPLTPHHAPVQGHGHAYAHTHAHGHAPARETPPARRGNPRRPQQPGGAARPAAADAQSRPAGSGQAGRGNGRGPGGKGGAESAHHAARAGGPSRNGGAGSAGSRGAPAAERGNRRSQEQWAAFEAPARGAHPEREDAHGPGDVNGNLIDHVPTKARPSYLDDVGGRARGRGGYKPGQKFAQKPGQPQQPGQYRDAAGGERRPGGGQGPQNGPRGQSRPAPTRPGPRAAKPR